VLGSTLVLLLAACGDDGEAADTPSPTETATATEEPSEPSETPEPTETEEPSETESPSASGETEIEAEDSPLGTILTDSEGNTLYVFLNDTGRSTCYGECQDNWPPLVAGGEVEARRGVDESLLGTTERADGTVQVTDDGQPLYYFAGDAAPGDTNGQGAGGVWFVVSPEGDPIQG
jgi:predicted lipoprotein with Yx(FWY)xxD motif